MRSMSSKNRVINPEEENIRRSDDQSFKSINHAGSEASDGVNFDVHPIYDKTPDFRRYGNMLNGVCSSGP